MLSQKLVCHIALLFQCLIENQALTGKQIIFGYDV